VRHPTWIDAAATLAVFWAPPTVAFLYLIWREGAKVRRERKASQTEAEAMAAEGYPPPGPPTTDSLSD
jgi:hypothetical protein